MDLSPFSADNNGTPSTPHIVLSTAYDATGNRTSLDASIDAIVDFQNDYQFDALGRMTRITQADGAPSSGYPITDKRVDLAYNAAGQFTTISRYEDLAATLLVATSTYGYDTAGRLTSLDHDKGIASLAAYGWTYDDAGRLTQTTSPDGTSTFSYDGTGQLTAATHSYQTDESYTYDANGNRTNTGYQTGTGNRLLSDGTYDYQYDLEGNRTRKTDIATGDYVDYTWDHRNRLTTVEFRTSGGTPTKKVEYSYDAFNRLIRRQADLNGDALMDEAQSFVYDGSNVVLVFDATGSLKNRFLHGPAVDQVFADEDALGEILWALADNQGTVRDVADYNSATGTTSAVNHLQYDAFGNITAQTASSRQPLLSWTGRYRDPITGLQWNLHRWYDPAVGRWISEDPAGFAAGDPNLQRYVHNSPLLLLDPTGLCAEATQQTDKELFDKVQEKWAAYDRLLNDIDKKDFTADERRNGTFFEFTDDRRMGTPARGIGELFNSLTRAELEIITSKDFFTRYIKPTYGLDVDYEDVVILTRGVVSETIGSNIDWRTKSYIAWVIRNRAANPHYPDTYEKCLAEPRQFSGWPRKAYSFDDRQISGRATSRFQWVHSYLAVLASFRDKTDPTKGTDHFYSPFNPTPQWAQGETPIRLPDVEYLTM